jgi:hypothetical protein
VLGLTATREGVEGSIETGSPGMLGGLGLGGGFSSGLGTDASGRISPISWMMIVVPQEGVCNVNTC